MKLPVELLIELPKPVGRLCFGLGGKGPGPDRLGFGLVGQGSWAGPAWGAKGRGPDRLGFGLGGQGSWAGPAFQKVPYLIVFNLKTQRPI